ncbi:MAG: DUF192 domain-containing protein [Azoarcus sp.]|nr:DUF192 domain-containing protein [Azoarcus sp.]
MKSTGWAMRTVLAWAALLWAGAAGAEMSQAELTLGKTRLSLEVAASEADRQVGLMYRTSLPEARGMVFVFASDLRICMWMRNTLIPLSVAFLDKNGRVINIEEMAPQTEDNHCSSRPARYALEVNRGWFGRHGIKAGDTVEGVVALPPGR